MGKLHFELHPETAAPIQELGHLLNNIPSARLFEEFNKLFMHGHALRNYHLLQEYHLLKVLLPQTEAAFNSEHVNAEQAKLLIEGALRNTDTRVKKDKPVTPAFLFAALLWPAYTLSTWNYQEHHKQSPYFASISATTEVISKQVQQIAIPRRLTLFIRETWQLQPRLVYLRKRNIARTIRHPRFRAAYDFLLLRAASGEPYQAVADWWTDFQHANEEDRQHLLGHMPAVKEIKKPQNSAE
jgi:poly(A) polymerase